MVCIGVIVVLYSITPARIWSSLTIFGFLFGGALAYFLRGSSIFGIKVVSDEVVSFLFNFLIKNFTF